jgi:hypothetical protein
MRQFFNLLLLFCLVPTIARTQVLEETKAMSLGPNSALTVIIQGTDTKFVDAEWKEYMKIYNVKVVKVKQSKETVTPGIQIVDIGGISKLNIYNLNETAGADVKTFVWISKDSGFINSTTYPKEYVASVKFVKDFAHHVKIDLITDELAAGQKHLEKDQSNQAKLVKENESLHKTIDDNKKKITQAGIDIDQNLKDQQQAQKTIDNQKIAVDEIQKRTDVSAKDIEAQVKLLSKDENNLAKLKKDNDNLHKLIDDSNKKIAQANTDIETNLKNQELGQKEIDNQKGIVDGVQKKLDAAKKQK